VDFYYTYYKASSLIQTWQGHRIWAIDGSKITLPNTPETRCIYPVQKNQFPTAITIQGQASFLYDVLNEICIHSTFHGDKSEKALVSEHLSYFKKDVIVLYDRLYVDYILICKLLQADGHFVIRCPLSQSFKVVQEFLQSSFTDTILHLTVPYNKKSQIRDLNLPEEVVVRALKIPLSTDETEILLTSLLDQEKYPEGEFRVLYYRRWGVETYLNHLKNQLDLERVSAKKDHGIKQDFYAIICVSTLESILTKEIQAQIKEKIAQRSCKYQYKMNRSISYFSLNRVIISILLDKNVSPCEILKNLYEKVTQSLSAVRPDRSFPRNILSPSQKHRFNKYVKKNFA
jgi:hypothetical protein